MSLLVSGGPRRSRPGGVLRFPGLLRLAGHEAWFCADGKPYMELDAGVESHAKPSDWQRLRPGLRRVQPGSPGKAETSVCRPALTRRVHVHEPLNGIGGAPERV